MVYPPEGGTEQFRLDVRFWFGLEVKLRSTNVSVSTTSPTSAALVSGAPWITLGVPGGVPGGVVCFILYYNILVHPVSLSWLLFVLFVRGSGAL